MEFYRPKDINVKVLDKTLQKGYFIPPIFSTSHSTQKHGEMQKFKISDATLNIYYDFKAK